MPFGVFEALAGSGIVFTTEWITLLSSYGFQLLLISMEALNTVRIYVIDLCDGGEGNGAATVEVTLPAANPVVTQPAVTQTQAIEPVVTEIQQSGTLSL